MLFLADMMLPRADAAIGFRFRWLPKRRFRLRFRWLF